jgi:hypothetical protein
MNSPLFCGYYVVTIESNNSGFGERTVAHLESTLVFGTCVLENGTPLVFGLLIDHNPMALAEGTPLHVLTTHPHIEPFF